MGLALQSLIGIVAIPLAAWAMSEDRRALAPGRLVRLVALSLALQITIVVLFLKVPQATFVLGWISDGVAALQRATDAGMQMVFGHLAGAPAPYAVTAPQHGFILAFRALPLILVMSALARLLYHWGVLQWVVRGFARLLQKSFGIGGPLGTAASANVFLGMVEAPLLVKPYLRELGRGALFASMVAGMATVAGTVMALYASILEPVLPGAAGHVLAASLMNVPAALMLSRLAVPHGFEGGPDTIDMRLEDASRSSMDAIAQGTSDGVRLLAGVGGMLIVMVALVTLANSVLSLLGAPLGWAPTLQGALGVLCAPVAWMIGIPWSEAASAGSLIGQKVVLNEFLAYLDLARLADTLSPRSRLILTYALCGFANLGSLGIMIGGLVAMAPERRSEIIALAPKSVLVGVMATLLTGAVVGLMSWS